MQRITDRTAGAIRHFYKSVIDTYLKMGAQFTFLLYEIVSAVIKCTYKTKQLHHMEPKSLRKTAAVPERKNWAGTVSCLQRPHVGISSEAMLYI